jgi:glycosyltransferase involved in cell wall biosynthesis
VFTPTHNPTYLAEVWGCLQAQTDKNWEWVVVPNGDMTEAVSGYVRQITGGDRRVRVIPAPCDVTGVGALKKFACDQCHGDVFIEYDHDDLITEDCLAEVRSAAERSPSVTFIYSDDVTMSFEGVSHRFMKEFGWRYYDWTYKGRKYLVNKQHEPTPRSLCEILYAPDHVRAWTRSAYKLAGGHNAALEVGDDHELIVRTYLKGAHFEHIGRPLYLHRLNESTTSQTRLDEISRTSRATRDRHLHELVREWCHRLKLPMFDLGGAHNVPPGYLPIDRSLPDDDPYKGDVFEVLQKIPSNSVGCFRASDFLEHVPIGSVNKLMNLLYDRLVPGGYLLTHTPAVCDDEGRCGRGAYQDPDHKSFWSSNNFWYYTDNDFAKYQNGDVTCRFQTIRVFNYYPSDFHRAHLIPYVLWDGMALKNDETEYYPGPRKI